MNLIGQCLKKQKRSLVGGDILSITEIGIEGENLARLTLKNWGCDNIFQADWLVQKNGQWYVVEVKRKERYIPPPFEGHGLDIRQVKARLQFYQDTGIRCLFLVFDMTDGNTYWQWLDVLDNGEYYDTAHRIRIYPIEKYKCIPGNLKRG